MDFHTQPCNAAIWDCECIVWKGNSKGLGPDPALLQAMYHVRQVPSSFLALVSSSVKRGYVVLMVMWTSILWFLDSMLNTHTHKHALRHPCLTVPRSPMVSPHTLLLLSQPSTYRVCWLQGPLDMCLGSHRETGTQKRGSHMVIVRSMQKWTKQLNSQDLRRKVFCKCHFLKGPTE